MPMSNIENFIKKAITTFSMPGKNLNLQENVQKLYADMNKLTLKDLFITKSFIDNHETDLRYDKKNPVVYIPVYEDGSISVGVFILKSQSVIPLHDHPMMYGLLKVVHGKMKIQTYSLTQDALKSDTSNSDIDAANSPQANEQSSTTLYSRIPLPVTKEEPIVISANDCAVLLQPYERNVHEIVSVNGPSAFLDVLAPPYYTEISKSLGFRRCTYFAEDKDKANNILLRPLSSKQAQDYWCIEAPFLGNLSLS